MMSLVFLSMIFRINALSSDVTIPMINTLSPSPQLKLSSPLARLFGINASVIPYIMFVSNSCLLDLSLG